MLHYILELAATQVVADADRQASRRMIRKAQRSHEKLVELVAARKADEAEAMWRRHLTESEEYILGTPGPKTVLDLLG
jgi:DNA-binding GntR family transcriptional regulator